jgi:hypothetical protein
MGLCYGLRLFGAKVLCYKRGYIGLVPPRSKIGDEIWAFLGAPTPYVLRRKTSNNVQERPFGKLTFELVG